MTGVVDEILCSFSEKESGAIYYIKRELETKRHEGGYCNHIAIGGESRKKVIRVQFTFPPFSKVESVGKLMSVIGV